jgi:hypothetical protein
MKEQMPVIWLSGNDSFREEMSRLSTRVEAWPQAQSGSDDDLLLHVSSWASDAARFWGQQGPDIGTPQPSPWIRPLWVLLFGAQSFKNAFWKDATGLGAWIEALRKVSAIDYPTRNMYRQIGGALEDWRLEEAALYLSLSRGQQGQQGKELSIPENSSVSRKRAQSSGNELSIPITRLWPATGLGKEVAGVAEVEVWPSTALVANALVYHDGVALKSQCPSMYAMAGHCRADVLRIVSNVLSMHQP